MTAPTPQPATVMERAKLKKCHGQGLANCWLVNGECFKCGWVKPSKKEK